MGALPFDTLDYARKLEAAGVPASQAEVHARALNEALAGSIASGTDITDLNAKIDTVESSLSTRIDTVESSLSARIDAVESSLSARIDAVESTLSARIDTVESRLSTRIESVKTELRLDLGGQIQTLKWMFGVLVAMNATIIARLFLEH